MTKRDVFISYGSEDKQIAEQICAGLESRDVKCWIAPRDVRLGENFAAAIVRGINSAPVFVLVFSKFSNGSQHVERELDQAARHESKVIPFRIDDVEPAEGLAYYLGRKQWLNALDGDLEKHIDRLARAVRRTADPSQEDAAGVVVEPLPPPPPPPAPPFPKKLVLAGTGVLAAVVAAILIFTDDAPTISQADLAGIWVLDETETRRAIYASSAEDPETQAQKAFNSSAMRQITLLDNGECRHDGPLAAPAPPTGSEVPDAACGGCGGSPQPVVEEPPPRAPSAKGDLADFRWRIRDGRIEVKLDTHEVMIGTYKSGLLRLQCSDCDSVYVYRRKTDEWVPPDPNGPA